MGDTYIDYLVSAFLCFFFVIVVPIILLLTGQERTMPAVFVLLIPAWFGCLTLYGWLRNKNRPQVLNLEKSKKDEVVSGLYEHLKHLGIECTLADKGDLEDFPFSSFVLGALKIKYRNLDMIIVSEAAWFAYYYVIRENVEGKRDIVRARFRPDWDNHCCLTTKGFKVVDRTLTAQEVAGARWEGGVLAQLLNTDSYLTATLYHEGLDQLEVWTDRNRRYICIWHPISHRKHTWTSKDMMPGDIWYDCGDGDVNYTLGRKQYPTREAFEAYDKIAQHIRTIASARHEELKGTPA